MLKRQPPHRLYRKSASAVFCIINIQLGSIRIGKDLKLWHVFIYGVLAADDERDELNEIRGTMARVVLNAICSILDLENTLCNGSRKTVVKHLLQHRAITKKWTFYTPNLCHIKRGCKISSINLKIFQESSSYYSRHHSAGAVIFPVVGCD